MSGVRSRAARGFTLVELLIVIAIIGILASLLLPAVQASREAARRMQCSSNLRQLGIAIQNYESAYHYFPSACIGDPYTDGVKYGIAYGDICRNGSPGWAWGTLLLPFVEQAPLFNQLDRSEPCWAPINSKLVQRRLPVYLCPSATGGDRGFEVQSEGADRRHGTTMMRSDGTKIIFGHSHYVTNAGVHQPWGRATAYCYDFDQPEPIPANGDALAYTDGVFYANSRLGQSSITDGTSNTVYLGEHSSILSNKTWVGVVPGAVTPPRLDKRAWLSENNAATCLVGAHSGPDTHDHPQVIVHAPNNPFGHTDEMWSEHGFGCNVVMGDGRVFFAGSFIDANVWVAMSTRNGGEVEASIE